MNRHSFKNLVKEKGLLFSDKRPHYVYSEYLAKVIEDGEEHFQEDIQSYADCSLQSQLAHFGGLITAYGHRTSNNQLTDDLADQTADLDGDNIDDKLARAAQAAERANQRIADLLRRKGEKSNEKTQDQSQE